MSLCSWRTWLKIRAKPYTLEINARADGLARPLAAKKACLFLKTLGALFSSKKDSNVPRWAISEVKHSKPYRQLHPQEDSPGFSPAHQQISSPCVAP